MRLTHEVDNTTGRSDKDVTTPLELFTLEAGGCAAVNDTGTHHGAIAEASSIIEDLGCKLSSWAHN